MDHSMIQTLDFLDEHKGWSFVNTPTRSRKPDDIFKIMEDDSAPKALVLETKNEEVSSKPIERLARNNSINPVGLIFLI
jgi:hypothetical protein